MRLRFFDPAVETNVHHGRHLPHWFQPEATYFVTFRTTDSVPVPVVKQFEDERRRWLTSRGVDAQRVGWHAELSPENRLEYQLRFSDAFHEYLDRGMGSCPLRDPSHAAIVSDSLHHLIGTRYDMSDFVIMPNHVHALFSLKAGHEIEPVCYSLKKYTATQLNRTLQRSGRFWQEESFDHIVRSEEQYEHYRKYIADNPTKAGLAVGEYIHCSVPLCSAAGGEG